MQKQRSSDVEGTVLGNILFDLDPKEGQKSNNVLSCKCISTFTIESCNFKHNILPRSEVK